MEKDAAVFYRFKIIKVYIFQARERIIVLSLSLFYLNQNINGNVNAAIAAQRAYHGSIIVMLL